MRASTNGARPSARTSKAAATWGRKLVDMRGQPYRRRWGRTGSSACAGRETVLRPIARSSECGTFSAEWPVAPAPSGSRGAVPNETITLTEAAERLGVHYMTAYRYVRTGRLPATKVGSEWRVETSRRRGHALGRGRRSRRRRSPGRGDRQRSPAPHRLPPPPRGPPPRRRRGRRRVDHRERPHRRGRPRGGVPRGPVARHGPHRRRLGRRTGLASPRSTARRSSCSASSADSAPASLAGAASGARSSSGAPPGDHHGVPVALAADLLRGAGFSVIDLGADSPASSFVDAGQTADRLIGIGISATSADNHEGIAEAIEAVHHELGCPVVLGGQGIADEATGKALGADEVTSSAPELIEVFGRLAADGRCRPGPPDGGHPGTRPRPASPPRDRRRTTELVVAPSLEPAGAQLEPPARRRRLYRWDDSPLPRLDDRVVVLTGFTSGLGLAAADRLAGLGAHLHLVGRSPDKVARRRRRHPRRRRAGHHERRRPLRPRRRSPPGRRGRSPPTAASTCWCTTPAR